MKPLPSLTLLPLIALACLGTVLDLGAASAESAPFQIDSRNVSASANHTVHSDNRAHLTADTVPGSLRQAIANAAPGETVDFASGLSGQTISLGARLDLTKNLAIDGSTLGNAPLISGDSTFSLVAIFNNSSVTVSALTLTNGLAPLSTFGGGGIQIFTGSSLTLNSSTVSGNQSADFGGGISNYGTLTIRTSTISGNHAASHGGGLFTAAGTAFIENTTITGNTTGTSAGAGIWSEGTGGSLTLGHVTVVGNTGANFTGVGVAGFSPSTLTLVNSLIGDNTTTDGGASDLFGDINTIGANLVEAHSGAVLSGPAPIVDNPDLSTLGDHGGSTQTMASLPGSAAVNGGVLLGGLPATDQRGFTRVIGDLPDLGAYESGNAAGYGVWAIERIFSGLNMTYTGDAEADGSPNGSEYALGTLAIVSDPDSIRTPTAIENASGHLEITFGFNPDAAFDTAWVLKRSTNMIDFDEIYRYDGPTSTETPTTGVTAILDADSFTVTDTNALTDRVFYQFVAEES